MTTVAELIAELQQMPQDAQVVIARDPEGNGYSPLAVEDSGRPDISVGTYVPESTGAGKFSGDLSAPGAVCLWPTN